MVWLGVGQGTRSTAFPLEAACVTHTLVLPELHVCLGQFGGSHL